MTASPVFHGRRWGGLDRTGPRRPAPPAAGDLVLEALGVEVVRAGRAIVAGVDLAIRAGEVVALVGPNGAGKSTLLGALAGDIDLDGGSVELLGASLGEWSGIELALRRAVLPQQVTVSFPFSVREVVEMGRAPWVALDGDLDGLAVVDDMIEAVEVGHLAERRIPTLSGGEQARAALARVLAQDTSVLLLDEPTAALDLRHQQLVLRLARSRAEAGAAVVVVLHDLGLAAGHADRIVVLRGGSVVGDGAPSQVLDAELLGEVYDHPVEVIVHPRTGRPLVIPL